jgi:murein DD-endopeptidase MepM/ murein hydrolase activator NlpD
MAASMVRRFAVGLALVVTLLAGAAPSASAPSAGGASARAFAIRLVAPGQSGTATRTVTAPPDSVEFGGGVAYPTDASILSSGSFTASASADAGQTASADATSEVTSVSLFGGEVAASGIAARARATAKPGSATGDLSGASVGSLTVLGQAAAVGANARVALGDWGYAITLEQAVNPAGDSYRGYVIALDIHLTADHGGLAAGSEIQIGYAEVAVQAAPAAPPPPKPGPVPAPARQGGTAGGKATNLKAPEPKRSAHGLPGAPIPRRLPPKLQPKLTAGGYVFPVYGPSSFTDTFGAPRADVSWHHGDDIFAPLGAPILAVAKGTVFSVGWNDIGGNRLWLRDQQGNEFYYAHLSAYTTLAVNGAHVRAGDVLGFVGNTGDAAGTPYHLHFEIHPVSMLGMGYDGVVDPTPYLTAWRHLQDVSFAGAAGWAPGAAPTSSAPKPGAILLEASDISTADGLDPGSLRRALRPKPIEGDSALLGAAAPSAPAAVPLPRG